MSYWDRELEANAFPHLFPTAQGTFSATRPVALKSRAEYASLYMTQKDPRWQADNTWGFRMLCHVMQDRISSGVNWLIKSARGGPGRSVEHGPTCT